MVNDTPFVPLPSPPRDPTQSDAEADNRGYDRDDEHAKALAYKEHLRVIAEGGKQRLRALVGDPGARRDLHRKTAALLPQAPPYVEE